MSLKGNKNNKRSRSEKKAFGSDSKKSGTVKSRDKGKYIDRISHHENLENIFKIIKSYL